MAALATGRWQVDFSKKRMRAVRRQLDKDQASGLTVSNGYMALMASRVNVFHTPYNDGILA